MILVIKDTNAVRTHHAIVHMSGSFSAVVFLSARKESEAQAIRTDLMRGGLYIETGFNYKKFFM
jgi:hypothetical protein